MVLAFEFGLSGCFNLRSLNLKSFDLRRCSLDEVLSSFDLVVSTLGSLVCWSSRAADSSRPGQGFLVPKVLQDIHGKPLFSAGRQDRIRRTNVRLG